MGTFLPEKGKRKEKMKSELVMHIGNKIKANRQGLSYLSLVLCLTLIKGDGMRPSTLI